MCTYLQHVTLHVRRRLVKFEWQCVLQELVNAGVDVFRLNTAHGTVEERDKQLADIRAIEDKLGRPIGYAVFY